MVEGYAWDDSLDSNAQSLAKNEDKYVIPTKFSDLKELEEGNIDTHLQHIGDLILSYNTAEDIDFDASLGEGGDDEEGGEGGDEEEEEDEDE